MKYVQNRPRNQTMNERKLEFWEKMRKTQNEITEKLITLFYPGELACMHWSSQQNSEHIYYCVVPENIYTPHGGNF